MMKVRKKLSDSACRLSWLLVEVHKGLEIEYYAIHSVEVLGDYNEAYVSRRVRFEIERRVCRGIIRQASDDLKIIENERNRLLSEQKNLSNNGNLLKADLWCLVRQTTDDSKVRLITVSCKKLTCVESTDLNRKHFLMQKDQRQIPTTLLHIIESEQELFEEMAFLNDYFLKRFMCDEKDQEVESGGLSEALFLVQYFEDTSNLIYTIVRYKDTIWKEKNVFPNVVAYISDGKVVIQCVILRKSYNMVDLTTILTEIRQTCDNLDYPQLHSQLQKTKTISESNQEVFPGS